MSGRRIDDHSFWAGGRSKESVFPMQAKMKQEHSAEGSGAMKNYPDTTEAIHHQQMENDKHLKSRPLKPGYRY